MKLKLTLMQGLLVHLRQFGAYFNFICINSLMLYIDCLFICLIVNMCISKRVNNICLIVLSNIANFLLGFNSMLKMTRQISICTQKFLNIMCMILRVDQNNGHTEKGVQIRLSPEWYLLNQMKVIDSFSVCYCYIFVVQNLLKIYALLMV